MEIRVDDKIYVLYVKYSYLDDTGNLVEEEMPIREWVDKVDKRSSASLFYLEEQLSKLLGREINLKRDFPDVRGNLLDLKGCISRLPDNFIIKKKECSDDCNDCDIPPDKGGFFNSSNLKLEFGKQNFK